MVRGRSRKSGLPPGTLVHIGEKKQEKVHFTKFEYDADSHKEQTTHQLAKELLTFDPGKVTWLNITGLHATEVIEEVGATFGLHPLVLEDIVNTEQRPKLEDYDDILFLVVRMLSFDEVHESIETEQVSFLLGPTYVLSFQEREGDVFNPVRERIRINKGRIVKSGADYLVYSLLDAIVDNYFQVLERIQEKTEEIEDVILANASPESLQTLHNMRRDMIFLRKSVWPLREVVSSLERVESPLIDISTTVYFRDVYDHTVQIMDMIDTLRDVLTVLMDIYLSRVSNQMNEVMKVLTIIATIFIPLTFIAGIYGMNFHYMPELAFPFGYPISLGVMGVIALGMLWYFRSKRWL